MKYFEVHKEELRGSVMSGVVYADGDYVDEADEQEVKTIITGFSVWEYGENGMVDKVEFYPVSTDMRTFEDDAEEVFENIKRDYPADEWQNHNW